MAMAPGRDALLFQCRQHCGRQLLVDRNTGGLVIVDRGDPWVPHTYASGGIELQVDPVQP
jgi:hypothetical protein